MENERVKLGDILVQQGVVSAEQLEKAIQEQKRTGAKLGQALVALGYVDEQRLLEILAQQLDLNVINLRSYSLDFQLAKHLPEAYARRFRAVLLADNIGSYLIGMVDPLDITATDELTRVLQKPIEVAIVRESDLLRTLDIVYRRTDEITSYAEELDEQIGIDESSAELMGAEDEADLPVAKLLKSVFEDAVQVGASDIHIEPDEKVLRIRLRVDGVLQEQIVKEKSVVPAIILRLKLVAGLNIAEKRIPQDGRFHFTVRDRRMDVRLSIMPTQYGENAVMRLLDQSAGLLDLEKIGMSKKLLTRFKGLLKKPDGVILVTGPTGSGKSTTLYGVLNLLNKPEKKIITIEDPVEYRLPRINQVQVNDKLGLTFSKVLRSTLRQDPDIVMVGEMRDTETAEIAMRAALTGHLVFSTLHTNDSVSSLFRLVDMGIEPFLVAAKSRGILAQRLVRKICESCKEPYQPDKEEVAWVTAALNEKSIEHIQFMCGSGCTYCGHTGYRGRIGVFELLELDAELLHYLCHNQVEEFTNHAKELLKGGLLIDSALERAKEGKTTLSEVIRVVGEE